MRLGSCLVSATFFAGIALLGLPSQLFPQESGPGRVAVAAEEPPEAPQPQFALASVDPAAIEASSTQSQNAAQSAPGSAQGSSSSQSSARQPDAGKSQHDTAEQQLKEQEHQRVLGVVPAFNISYRFDAVSLTRVQKIKLAFRSSIDPVTFGAAFLVAGYHEALDDDTEFGWGIEGYGKRAGAAYLDAFDGTMIGNGFLPAILHQDPRYFRLGHGTTTHRMLYALATNVICRHDNTGKWEPNYSNVSGNIISGAISNLYYPSQNSGIGQTLTNGFIVTGEGAIGSLFQEFWPDISRHFLHKDPTQGRDAQARALDAEEKKARQEQKQNQNQK